MPPSDPTSSTDRNPVERLAEEFLERQRRGEHPSLGEYTSRFPELADEIRDLFPALVMIEQLKPVEKDVTGSVAATPVPSVGGIGQPMGAWATTGCSARSAGAEWESSTRRCKSRWAGTSRSRSCS